MGYAEINPTLKNIKLKPKGEVEIVLTTSMSDLRASIGTMSDMIDQKVRVALDSTVVTYNVQINARTEKPIKSYRVDEQGVVSEIKPEGEQVEMDLGLPKDKLPIEEVKEEIDRSVVDEFILALLAPQYDDLPYPFYAWVCDIVENGATYSQIATSHGMTGKNVSDLIDEYRGRVAPLASAWDNWRKTKVDHPPAEEAEKGADDDSEAPEDAEQKLDNIDDEDTEHELTQASDGDDIEAIILQEKPAFPDIPFDFPTLLSRRKSGETWMQIASSLGESSTKLAAAYNKYKKRIKEQRGGAA